MHQNIQSCRPDTGYKKGLKVVCHEIFYLYFFPWLEAILAPDKQGKVFLNLVSISPRYSITKLEKFDLAVCMTPQSQNVKLSK